MSELTEEEKTKARFEMLNARIKELEEENKHYLELLSEKDKTIKDLKCCGNCKYYQWYDSFEDHVCCFEQHGRHIENTDICNKWEETK